MHTARVRTLALAIPRPIESAADVAAGDAARASQLAVDGSASAAKLAGSHAAAAVAAAERVASESSLAAEEAARTGVARAEAAAAEAASQLAMAEGAASVASAKASAFLAESATSRRSGVQLVASLARPTAATMKKRGKKRGFLFTHAPREPSGERSEAESREPRAVCKVPSAKSAA